MFNLQVEVSWKSFDTGSVFLLDLGKAIIQWNGPESNTQERLKVGTSRSSAFMKLLMLQLHLYCPQFDLQHHVSTLNTHIGANVIYT